MGCRGMLMPLLVSAAAVVTMASVHAQTGGTIDLAGHWRLNQEVADEARPDPEVDGPDDRATRRPPRGGASPGGRLPGGRRGGDRQPQAMADPGKVRDAMRALMTAPRELIVTRHTDEIVFTAMDIGEVIRVLVLDRKVRTTAGGLEHDVKAAYRDGALRIERSLGRLKILDTYRVSADGTQLERTTAVEGGPDREGRRQPVRRVYDRVTGPE